MPKANKQLQKILNSEITIPIYWTGNTNKGKIMIDEESMKEEFETKLNLIIEIVKQNQHAQN